MVRGVEGEAEGGDAGEGRGGVAPVCPGETVVVGGELALGGGEEHVPFEEGGVAGVGGVLRCDEGVELDFDVEDGDLGGGERDTV